jgi:hypothetical protein
MVHKQIRHHFLFYVYLCKHALSQKMKDNYMFSLLNDAEVSLVSPYQKRLKFLLLVHTRKDIIIGFILYYPFGLSTNKFLPLMSLVTLGVMTSSHKSIKGKSDPNLSFCRMYWMA